jgi:chorismate dehydratase
MNVLTLGSVPYLNAKPLVARFADPEQGVRVLDAVPSVLAGMLERREVAAAMVSSAVPLADPSLCVVSGGAITSDGPVRSIRLFSRVPPNEIRRLALDASSRTSTLLCRILLARVYGVTPEILSRPPDVPRMLEEADAALVIGDPALLASVAAERGELTGLAADLDLGSLWRIQTGRPFVYAVWAAPRDGDIARLTRVLDAAKQWGVAHLDDIARDEAPGLGLPEDLCRRYLTENVRYNFGPRERDGLRLFHAWGMELGLFPRGPEPILCGETSDAVS